VSAAVFAVAPFTSLAQLTPPAGFYEWSGQGADTNWSNASNWAANSGGSPVNDPEADVFFAAKPSGPEENVNIDSLQTLRSLWFDGSRFYTLSGGMLTLGATLEDGGHIVAVTNQTGRSAETNIDSMIVLDDAEPGRLRVIENASGGGLRFGDVIDLGSQNLLITGGQATHFHGDLWGSGSITVTGPSGPFIGTPTQLVLQGNNAASWSGALNIESHAMGIIKGRSSLSSGPTTVHSGGTLAWRSHLDRSASPIPAPEPIRVEGMGVVRQDGTLAVGAIYNDGGINHVGEALTLTGDTWFGSRGDLYGALWLRGQISDGGAGHSFIKVGPGLIILADNSGGGAAPPPIIISGLPPGPPLGALDMLPNLQGQNDLPGKNTWGKTILRDGVLRIAAESALPEANLVFEGGTLELGWGGGDFSRDLGTGAGEVQWTGDGGFSSSSTESGSGFGFGVILNNWDVLTWGQEYFVQDNHALLFGSRYSDRSIEFWNAIDLAGDIREIRVARGLSSDSYALLWGELSNGGLRKTGDGLLILAGFNTYSGATQIEGGALRGAVGNTTSNIQLDGGVLAFDILDSDFTRGLGDSGNQIRWLGSGGFAAYEEDRIVRINNDSINAITWGSEHFVANDKELIFGYRGADATVLWDNALALGNGKRTIRINRSTWELPSDRANVLFQKDIRGEANSKLYLVGDGRMDINVANPDLQSSHIYIYGAELRLHSGGTLNNHATTFELSHGGILTLDNIGMHSSSDGGGSHNADRIHDQSSVILKSAFLNYNHTDGDPVEKLGLVHLESGANRFMLMGELHIERLLRDNDSRAVLEFTSDSPHKLKLTQSGGFEAINANGGTAITPWGTDGNAWLTVNGNELARLETYHTGLQSTWGASHNVLANTNQTLTGSRTVNSLIFENSARLNLNFNTLTLNSGGLMTSPDGGSILGGLGSKITTASNRPLYIHGGLTISGNAAITGGMDLVKSRVRELFLSSDATHLIGSLYIHQGGVVLSNGYLSISGEIVIGDGAGEISLPAPNLYADSGQKDDILELPGNRWNPLITPDPNVFPKITLHGTPYDSRGPEDGNQAILRMGGNTKQQLRELHIHGRGTIDWAGGEVGQANILWLDSLTFSDSNAILFMRNWYEYEDYLLVKAGGFDLAYLQNIRFEGYENYTVQWIRYDNNFYQITPFPEPATTGAILGAAGIGLWIWRKRRRQQNEAATS